MVAVDSALSNESEPRARYFCPAVARIGASVYQSSLAKSKCLIVAIRKKWLRVLTWINKVVVVRSATVNRAADE
jgi:hypothetical protein